MSLNTGPGLEGTVCRVCGAGVKAADLRCPACGAPRPGQKTFHGEGFEWRTQGSWLGVPIVHIAFGMDESGRARVAKGVVAIGQRAVGGIAVGIVATGFLAIGVVSVGLFSAGVVALAGAGACGVNAFAPFAIGVVAGGYWAGGVAALGWRILF